MLKERCARGIAVGAALCAVLGGCGPAGYPDVDAGMSIAIDGGDPADAGAPDAESDIRPRACVLGTARAGDCTLGEDRT